MLKIDVKVHDEPKSRFLNKAGSGRVLCWAILSCQAKGSSSNAGSSCHAEPC